jgi:predicted RNase H-like HicB family nuclease
MHEAIEEHIRGLHEDHLPIPEPSATAEYVEVGP